MAAGTKQTNESAFVKFFRNNPIIKVLDFLLDEGRTWDYSATEIAKYSGVSRQIVDAIIPELEKTGVIKATRRIGRAQLYKLNEECELTQNLIKIDSTISKLAIDNRLEKEKVLA